MLESILTAITTILSWPVILYVFAGALLGMFFGAVPGLGGLIVLSLLLPFTVILDLHTTMALYGSALGGVAFGGSISAILLNVPGTAPNAATCLDGYPMTKNGESGKAIGASATASALGALFGVIVLIALIPVARSIILSFAAPEFFMLTILGISVIAFVTQGHFFKGLISGGFGLLVSFIGIAQFTGNVRYNVVEMVGLEIGTLYLYDGIKLVPAAIGIFALSEAMYLIATKRETIARTEQFEPSRDVLSGVRAVVSRPKLFLQSSVIGVLIGMVPGVGGAVSNFVSYLRATQTPNHPERFGTGDVRGVIASEAANDSKDGGALLPTLAFGIPGSPSAALVLAALTLKGIRPGPTLLTHEIDVVFTLLFALIAANVITSVLGLSLAGQLSRISVTPVAYIIPVILVVSLFGAYVADEMVGDVLAALVFGILGFLMVLHNYSRIAFIIGLILGPIAENTLYQSLNAYDQGWAIFLTRPISLLILLAILFTFAYPIIQRRVTQA